MQIDDRSSEKLDYQLCGGPGKITQMYLIAYFNQKYENYFSDFFLTLA